MGYTIYEPPSGERFLHAYIKFRNDSNESRVFSYDACGVDLDGIEVLPGMVTRYRGVMTKIEKNETYAPGEENSRNLTYNYPVGRLPSRIKCAHVTFDIPHR